MENAIKLTGITKRYKDFKLEDVTLTLPAGYIMGLIGENGAGKTTLIKTMLGLAKQDGGTVEFFDSTFDPNDRDCKEHIGVVLDTCSFPEDMTGKELDRMMASCYKTWSSEKFRGYMEGFKLPTDKNSRNSPRV